MKCCDMRMKENKIMKMISRRDFMKASAVVGAAGVLTACGGSSSSTAASAAGSAAASGDTIKIGVMGPLTGNVFRLRPGRCQRRCPVPEAGQRQRRHQWQADRDPDRG